jgi:hypothetical protein
MFGGRWFFILSGIIALSYLNDIKKLSGFLTVPMLYGGSVNTKLRAVNLVNKPPISRLADAVCQP